MNKSNRYPTAAPEKPFLGQPWLVEERDACGVGFIADVRGEGSHQLIQQALLALGCLEHRGGCSADQDSGDGSGLMTAIPHQLFAAWFAQQGKTMPPPEQLGVGMTFLPQDLGERETARSHIEEVLRKDNLNILGWREVPVKPEVLGLQARENQPHIAQVMVSADGLAGDALDRALYIARSHVGKQLADDFYICSFSCRTIVYKGMVRSVILGEFYEDLLNPLYKSRWAIYHRRFSTNTMPKWPLAQPMRLLGHNGEINTLLGNINWMAARETNLSVPGWTQAELESLTPIVNPANSDSYNLDSAMEMLVRTGKSPLEAATILIPEAYQNQPDLANFPEIVDFYQYYSGLQEPWDGPALVVFSDGKTVGACLDRNGLRPARYCITKDDYIVVGSEAGVVALPEADIVEKGRLGPGQAIAVDLPGREIQKNWQIKQRIAQKHPYGDWVKQYRQQLTPVGVVPPCLPCPQSQLPNPQDLLSYQTAFGYTAEDVDLVIVAMAETGKEATFCMGDDIPLAVLSEKPRLLYDYFKQRFAQVTNPAIDPLRESLVMSLNIQLGKRGNLLSPTAEAARLLALETPILNEAELAAVQASDFTTVQLSTLFPLDHGTDGLQRSLERLCQEASKAVKEGAEILILTDRPAGESINPETSYIPPLLAVGAVHQHLIRQGLRLQASLIMDTAQCWSTHHFACLVGYGASAICPYLALETVRQWWGNARTQNLMANGKIGAISQEIALKNYRQAVEAGLLKILSKMGISLLSSYHGAQIFEALGLGTEVIELAFKGTTSRIGGLNLAEIAQENLNFHNRAFPLTASKLENFGLVNYRPSGEYHMNSPEMAKYLHQALATYQIGGNGSNQQALDYYALYQQYLKQRPPTALRDLLQLKSDRQPIPLETVEAVEAIVRRFCTGGMSLGALSREAHETLAIAMNRLGGKSNSGEGGEDPTRFGVLEDVDDSGYSPTFPHLKGLCNGDTANSAIKQVASGRFGVTPHYLMKAQQIEIKLAQGAKPGEGGQLPGKKVSPYIAMLRRSKPGVTLISPPPHHDIYSIEDLAQLIFDLHSINPQAKVSVKLVAEVGIGTIAAGVAKANADIIQISGHDGGTGASPLSSIKHAGSPWELGVTEVHRTLLENQLRDRVILRADGGLKTGWDVLVAALLGAEEFGFGSIAMIAEGCIMARICHTNNCPVGVATQQERLRQRFSGTPAQVVNFFYFVAEELRSLLAYLGYRSLDEVIGRSDLLETRASTGAWAGTGAWASTEAWAGTGAWASTEAWASTGAWAGTGAPPLQVRLAKTDGLNLDCLLDLPDVREDRSWLQHENVHSRAGTGALPVQIDDLLLADAEIAQAINIPRQESGNQGSVVKELKIVNTDRSVGARIAGAIARQETGTPSQQISLNFVGAAGQSFGAFNLPGMILKLTGEANDYVGKGMHGGEIIIVPPPEVTYNPSENTIIGNTCLYGATGGFLSAYGRAGERFAVRNSKAQAVIEGAGDHCCEYMTGGVIVVLGSVGRNVAAGMTGGLAYFLDEDGSFSAKVNREIVKIQRVATEDGEAQLRGLIEAHYQRTKSGKAKSILADWQLYLGKFWQVVPPSEANSPEANPDAVLVEKEKALSYSP